jgi:hypothetical protein
MDEELGFNIGMAMKALREAKENRLTIMVKMRQAKYWIDREMARVPRWMTDSEKKMYASIETPEEEDKAWGHVPSELQMQKDTLGEAKTYTDDDMEADKAARRAAQERI